MKNARKHRLFDEIDRFDRWARKRYSIPQDDIGGEWELNYDNNKRHNWSTIYSAFEDFLQSTDHETWTDDEIDRILYILARDNEIGWIAKLIAKNEDILLLLTKHSLKCSSFYTKYQLAVQLGKISDRNVALELLEQFVADPDEYVVRRSLMMLAELGSDKVESLCKTLWHKDTYGEWEEYQRMAILTALKTIRSDQLPDYLDLAEKDGRKFLLAEATRIKSELLSNEAEMESSPDKK